MALEYTVLAPTIPALVSCGSNKSPGGIAIGGTAASGGIAIEGLAVSVSGTSSLLTERPLAVWGSTSQSNGVGLAGTADDGFGVLGINSSQDSAAGFFQNTATEGLAAGVEGETSSATGYGVYGVNTSGGGYGVYGVSTSGYGVTGTARSRRGYPGSVCPNRLKQLLQRHSRTQYVNQWPCEWPLGADPEPPR